MSSMDTISFDANVYVSVSAVAVLPSAVYWKVIVSPFELDWMARSKAKRPALLPKLGMSGYAMPSTTPWTLVPPKAAKVPVVTSMPSMVTNAVTLAVSEKDPVTSQPSCWADALAMRTRKSRNIPPLSSFVDGPPIDRETFGKKPMK